MTVSATFEFSGKYFDWEMRQGAESRFLVLNLKKEVELKPFLEKVALRGIASKSGEAATDTLFLVSQPKLESSVADDAPSYMHNVGKTVNVAGDIFAAPKEPFLDFDLIYGTKAFVKTPQSESWGRERSGVDYEELVDNMWQELGISVSSLGFTNQGAPTPTRSKLFSGSFNERFQHNRTSSNRFEYHVDVHVKPMVELHMATAIYTTDNDPDVFLPYLTATAQLLLNVSYDDLYMRYPNTKEGIYDLYDTYGTHVLVGGVFGGSYTYIYSRKENMYYDETVLAAEAELSAKSASPAGENENWLQTYYRVMGTHGGKIGAGGGYTKSELNEHMSEESIMIITGGNASVDFESWDNSIADENSNLHLVRYGPKGDSTNCFMIPLYYLTKDSTRKNALKEHLNAYVEEHSKLEKEPKLIVADFMMRTGKDDHGDPAGQRVFTGPDGKERYVKAEKGVILCAGGFGMNRDLIRAYLPSAYEGTVQGGPMPSHTGEAFRMGLGMGADFSGFDSWSCWEGAIDEETAGGDGQFWHYFWHGERQLFHNPWLIIDKRGNRQPYFAATQELFANPGGQMGDLSNCAAWMSACAWGCGRTTLLPLFAGYHVGVD